MKANHKNDISCGGMLKRRSFLKAMTSVTLAPSLPVMAQTDLSVNYIGASSVLLGIPANSLEPKIQPDKLSYGFRILTESALIGGGSAMEAWLSLYEQELKQGIPNDKIAIDLYSNNGAVSRLTMKLWLFGIWTGNNEMHYLKDGFYFGNSYKQNFVYSALAYRRGWIWRIAQAHPMGYSHYDLNSWSSSAPSLSDYGIT